MSEQYVPVPVSLIESAPHGPRCAWVHNHDGGRFHCVCWKRELTDLLSQPTPTAEPPRIEDMAPGTNEMHKFEPGRYSADGIQLCRARSFDGDGIPAPCHRPIGDSVHSDPSTIRDITPPTPKDPS